MKARLPSALVGLAVTTGVGAASPAQAEVTRFSDYPSQTALTTPPGRLNLGVFSAGTFSPNERVELRLHPLWFFVLPHVEAKVRWLDAGPLQLSSVHRLSYPTWFLGLVSREGSLGLLPPTTDVPIAVLLESDVLGSVEWQPGHWLSLELGAALALQGGGNLPVLDFPFLYQRFAALSAPWVPRLGLSLEGSIGPVAYALDYHHYVLPLDGFETFHANEWSARAYLEVARGHRIGAGARLSAAHFPIGWRTHALPFIDYQLAL